jgi:hypothetical protein
MRATCTTIIGGVRVMKRLIMMISVVSLIFIASLTPAFAGIGRRGISGVQVQNLSSTQAQLTVSFYPQSSGSPVNIPDTVSPFSARTFYTPSISGLSSGSYSMVVSSNQPTAAIVRTDWDDTSGAAIYDTVRPGKDILIPLALQNFAGQVSQFTVQNASGTSANDIKIEVIARGTGAVVKTLSNQQLNAYQSRTYDLGNTSLFGTLPDTGRDLGATGFVGLIRISSNTVDLVAQSFIDVTNTPAVTAFSSVAVTDADDTLYCPLVRANYYGDTGIQIVNPNNQGVDVTITFYADSQSPNRGTFTQRMTIPANSSDIAFQGPGGNSRQSPTNLPGGTQTQFNTALTNNGFFGSAVISTNGPKVLAVVNDTEFGRSYSVLSQGSYSCVPKSAASTKHFLPLLRSYHLQSTRLTTGVQVMNVGNVSNTISLDLIDWDGTDHARDPNPITINGIGGVNFFGGNWTGLRTVPSSLGGFGWYGSGVVNCTSPCVVFVSDEGFGRTQVDRANYIGIPGP